MNAGEYRFVLPIGFEDQNGDLHRDGCMRLATAADELAVYTFEKTAFNARLRDLFLLARVITKLGEKTEISVEDLEEFFETDFLYLQTLFRTINNGESAIVQAVCPNCRQSTEISLNQAFQDMAYQFAEKPDTAELNWQQQMRDS